MVLLAAYGNFQDRNVLGLQLPLEEHGPLEQDLGPAKAMSTFWWLCRGLYMTRISDGFQLPLERENVFGEAPKQKTK